MSSLSERAAEFVEHHGHGQDGSATIIDMRWELVRDMAVAIENMTQANHNLAATVEQLHLRIEELESQVEQLAPPKDIGPIVKPAWKPVSESDLPAGL